MRLLTSARRIAVCGIIISLALIVHYLENLLPPLVVGLPIKLGLANVFTLYALMEISKRDAFFITLIRSTLGALIGGSMTSLLYSVCGGMLSYVGMCLLLPLYRRERITVVGMSVFGAFAFNIGQLGVGTVLNGRAMLLYFPILSVLSLPTGLFIGLLSATLISRVHVKN